LQKRNLTSNILQISWHTDTDLKWQEHKLYIQQFFNILEYFIKSEQKFHEVLQMIYFAFGHSQILYGIEVLLTPFQLILLNLVF